MPSNSAVLDSAMIPVQLCYSIFGRAPVLLDLHVTVGNTVNQLLSSVEPALRKELQAMLEEGAVFAIFGKKKTGDFVLSPGDRIEICRPLMAGPMDARRRRAKREHKSGKM